VAEEPIHVDDEILDDREAHQRLDLDLRAHVADQHLAGEPIHAVDAERVRAADAVLAGASQREGPIEVPLDVVEAVEHPVGRLRIELEGVEVGVLSGLRLIPVHLERYPHQYTRSLGSKRVMLTGL
jgi:hypothetical protein